MHQVDRRAVPAPGNHVSECLSSRLTIQRTTCSALQFSPSLLYKFKTLYAPSSDGIRYHLTWWAHASGPLSRPRLNSYPKVSNSSRNQGDHKTAPTQPMLPWTPTYTSCCVHNIVFPILSDNTLTPRLHEGHLVEIGRVFSPLVNQEIPLSRPRLLVHKTPYSSPQERWLCSHPYATHAYVETNNIRFVLCARNNNSLTQTGVQTAS